MSKETAAAVLVEVLFRARKDLQGELAEIERNNPDEMVRFLASFYRTMLGTIQK